MTRSGRNPARYRRVERSCSGGRSPAPRGGCVCVWCGCTLEPDDLLNYNGNFCEPCLKSHLMEQNEIGDLQSEGDY